MNSVNTNIILVAIVGWIIVIQIARTSLKGSQFTCYGRANCPEIWSDCFGYGVSERAFEEANINDKNCMINLYWRHSPMQLFFLFVILCWLVVIFYIQNKWLDENDEKKSEKISIFVLSIVTSLSLLVSLIIGGNISLVLTILLVPLLIYISIALYNI